MIPLLDWTVALTFIFGGCCSNAITLERLTSSYPRSGILITFIQFIVVFLYSLPSQLTFQANDNYNGLETLSSARRTWLPRLKKRRVPLLPYFIQVVLFFVLSILNNAAFAYHIPMTVHIIFRSGGMIVNMALGWSLAKKWYTPRQVISVFVVTVGIMLTTLSASKPKPQTSSFETIDRSLYAQGIFILSLALLLSGFLGLVQDWVFSEYVKPTEARFASVQPSWQENVFYLHSLALPLFYLSKDTITTELSDMNISPTLLLASVPVYLQSYVPGYVSAVPSIFLYLFLNTITQLICVIGVNRITGRISSLTVTLILTVRKAVSLLLSVAVYGGPASPIMWTGAALVFLGTIGYSTAGKPKPEQDAKRNKED